MNRRRVLVAAGGASLLSGCLSAAESGGTGSEDDVQRSSVESDSQSTASYETCDDRAAIRYSEFPPELQTEIEAAIDGGYTPADRAVRLAEAVDFESTYVVHDGYYLGRLEDGTLSLEEVPEPTGLETTRSITVAAETDATAELVRDGTVVETATDAVRLSDVVWGRYELVVERDDGTDESISFGVGAELFDITLTVRDESIDVEQDALERVPCPWGV